MNNFHQDLTIPKDNSIFVFGSNLAGIHGAGAARIAFEKFGAKWGKGVGHEGKSYAIPTKDYNIKTLNLEDIEMHVNIFVNYTKRHPELHFFVTRIGCGLAGYSDREIAPMFKGAINCSFPREWRSWLK